MPRSGGKVEQQLYKAALKGEDTDVEFKFGDLNSTVLHAHRTVLVSESKVFKVMLKDCWKRNSDGSSNEKTVIDLPEDDVEDFKIFLRFLYGSEPFWTSDCLMAVPAYNLADKYEATRVIKSCKEYFFGWRNYVKGYLWLMVPCSKFFDELGKLLSLSRTCHDERLFPVVLKYVKKSLGRILVPLGTDWLEWDEFTMSAILDADTVAQFQEDSTLSSNELYLFERAIQWIEHQSRLKPSSSNKKSPRVIDSALAVRILQKIRFTQMKSKHFKMCLTRLAGILSVGQIGQISLQYSGMDAAELVDTYKNEDHFIVDSSIMTAKQK